MVQTFIHCNILLQASRGSGKGKETDLAQAGEGKDGVILKRRNYQ